ncbi:MAG TPA: hypothetical protein VFR67_22370 [Pilimelia sp.]|nr:hypothetical protein [Pilimelia sp.]
MKRIRQRREASRHARSIEHAVRAANTPAVREEILALASRYYR